MKVDENGVVHFDKWEGVSLETWFDNDTFHLGGILCHGSPGPSPS